MLSNHNLGALMGAPVVGPDNEKIGSIGQVFVDPDTGTPNWVTVHTGLFGRHESFVPVDDATWDHEILHIPFDKQVVKDAPRIDSGGALSPADERSLYRYYRVPVTPTTDSGDGMDTADYNDTVRSTAEPEDDSTSEPGISRMRRYVDTDPQRSSAEPAGDVSDERR